MSAAAAALPVGHDRAAALFRAYDVLGRGLLDRATMVAALAELSVVAGLDEGSLNAVLAQDPATSRDHRYSLHEFLAMYERVGLHVAKVGAGTATTRTHMHAHARMHTHTCTGTCAHTMDMPGVVCLRVQL